MELLQGETLNTRISNKPVALNTLLDWAIQITDGLDGTHARGIDSSRPEACKPARQ
jgi:hypothetical protein